LSTRAVSAYRTRAPGWLMCAARTGSTCCAGSTTPASSRPHTQPLLSLDPTEGALRGAFLLLRRYAQPVRKAEHRPTGAGTRIYLKQIVQAHLRPARVAVR
jgi:hypothetical protein